MLKEGVFEVALLLVRCRSEDACSGSWPQVISAGRACQRLKQWCICHVVFCLLTEWSHHCILIFLRYLPLDHPLLLRHHLLPPPLPPPFLHQQSARSRTRTREHIQTHMNTLTNTHTYTQAHTHSHTVSLTRTLLLCRRSSLAHMSRGSLSEVAGACALQHLVSPHDLRQTPWHKSVRTL